jgi:RNA polymerase primary sigma factor
MIAVLDDVQDREEVSYRDDDQGVELAGSGVVAQRSEIEAGEDILGLYFADVGQTPLLDADGEKRLGSQIEEGKHLARAEEEFASPDGATPGAVELLLALTERVNRSWSLVEAVGEYLGLPPGGSVVDKITHPELRRAIDGHIEEQLSAGVAEATGEDQAAIEADLVQLSLDSRLMPWDLMAEVAGVGEPAEFREALNSAEVRDKLEGQRSQVAAHFQQIRERARRATNQMIQANLRLVVSKAKGHANRGVPLHDIIQEGNIGLMQAVQKFDHRRGYKFSTYAIPWIWQAINRGVNEQSRVVHLPGYLIDDLTKLSRVRNSLAQELGRQPGDEELAAQMGLSSERIQALRNLGSGGPASLDAPLDEDGSPLGDLIADEDVLQPEELAATSLLGEELDRTLEVLTPRERRVIELRFGLGDEYSHTLAEVGSELGLTKERIRQIEKEALAKLRHPSRSRELIGYLG